MDAKIAVKEAEIVADPSCIYGKQGTVCVGSGVEMGAPSKCCLCLLASRSPKTLFDT